MPCFVVSDDQGMTEGLHAGVQAASHAPSQHPLAGRWVHETELPLWLIKAFEERSRREAAVEAARAAREAAREAARGEAVSLELNATAVYGSTDNQLHAVG